MNRYAADYARDITTKWIAYILRKRLNLKTHKSNGVFIISPSELPVLSRLYEKYGIESGDSHAASTDE